MFLKRYTSLSSVLDILHRQEIDLLSPDRWDDKNDSHYMREYKSARELKTLLAICFSEGNETYHQWRVFASGSDGVCITFSKIPLVSMFNDDIQVRSKEVSYITLDKLKASPPRVDDLPFIKRYAFQHEHEFRVIFESKEEDKESQGFGIDLDWITSISLSPWMPAKFRASVASSIRSISGCKKMRVSRSTLIGNDQWMQAATTAKLASISGSLFD
jgi:hypothetical protein